jgi:FkbM family methyltransferase
MQFPPKVNHRLNVLRGYYHQLKAGARELVKPRTIHVRLPKGSSFSIPRADEIAERIATQKYETDVVRFFQRVLTARAIAFDLGAHCGYFSLLMREGVGPEGEVHSFEPSPATFRRLSANIRRNHFENVHARQSAVGAQDGRIILNAYNGERAAYSTLGTPPFPDSIGVEVPMTSLDQYAEQQSITQIDLLKMDVEGSELEVLKGAARLLAKCALKIMVFEVNDIRLASRATTSAALLGHLKTLNYALYDLDEQGRLRPAKQKNTYDYQNLVAVAPGTQVDACLA